MIKSIKKAIAVALFATSSIASADTIGAHLFSVHDRGNRNNDNYGLYYERSNVVAGVYKNSDNGTSRYVSFVQERHIKDDLSGFVTVGVVNGYTKDRFQVFGSVGVKYDINDKVGARLAILPSSKKDASRFAIHSMVEYKF